MCSTGSAIPRRVMVTRLVGPIPAKLPLGIMFFGKPFSEPTLSRIASAYEAAKRNTAFRPPDFGPVPEP